MEKLFEVNLPVENKSIDITCRLCLGINNNPKNLCDVFDPERGYDKKISLYLYLRVSEDDGLSRKICWSCSSYIDNFHMFYDKIHETQRNHLGEQRLKEFVLRPIYTVDIIDDLNEGGVMDDGELLNETSTVLSDAMVLGKSEVLDHGGVIEVLNQAESTKVLIDEGHCLAEPFEDYEAAESQRVENLTTAAEVQEMSYVKVFKDDPEHGYMKILAAVPQSAEEAQVEDPPTVITRVLRSSRRSVRPVTRDNSKRVVKTLADELISAPFTVVKATDKDDDDGFPPLDLDKNFPSTMIQDGLVVVRGKRLQRLVTKFYSLKCEMCGTRLLTFTSLMEHYRTEHKQVGSVNCCGFKLKKYRAAVLHMAKHLQPDAFKCQICGYIVTRPHFLEKHKLTHLATEEKPYACPDCPKRFVWKGAWKIHCATHKPPDQRKSYLCHICSKQYDTPGGLSTHKRLAHGNEKQEKSICHICSKDFATRAGLNEHMATIHQEQREKNQLQCKECGQWLMNKRCLKTHMLLHTGVDIRCDECSYVTKKRTLLNRHKVTHHSTEKPFACSLCSKQFKLRRALTVHLQVTHANVPKSYKCDFCEKTFGSSTNYYSHRKNIHPVELKQLQEKKAQEKRLKRIEVGLETPAITVLETQQSSDGNTQTYIIQLE